MADHLRGVVHDRVDAMEDLRERAEAIIEEIRPMIVDWLNSGIDIEEVAMLVAEEASKRLAPLTTEAVRLGAYHGRRLVNAG